MSAPSRLHFGLLSIGEATQRKFGGAGLMINSPRTEVLVSPSDQFELKASHEVEDVCRSAVNDWLANFANAKFQSFELDQLPVKLSVEAAPRHNGLGSGTQLAFAIATALQVAFDAAIPSTTELSMAMGRGKRSAIGSYGFHQGGFLVDRGIEGNELAPLELRLEFPEPWKIVLIQPISSGATVFGDAELEAFRKLPATTQQEADELASLLGNHIVPSMMDCDFEPFASSVTEYGYRSGLFYSSIQGGAYASAAGARIVELVSGLGEFAVGQSSWGPLIFAICESENRAMSLVEYLGEHGEDVVCQSTVTSADNRGVVIQQD